MVEILLDGVEQSRRDVALKDFKRTLGFLPELHHLIDKIVVASDFCSTIRLYTRHLDYESIHEYGQAVGKTLPTREGNELRFVIVFDGKVFGSWAPERRLDRMKSLWHELAHVGDMTRQARAVGLDVFFSEPKSKRDALLKYCWNIWMEYNAERAYAESLTPAFSETIGVEYDFLADTMGYIRTLSEQIDGLRDYLNANIRNLEGGRVAFEEAVLRVNSRLNSILILMAYVLSIETLDAGVKSRVIELRQKQNFLLFLSEDFDSIACLLDRLFACGGEYREDLLQNMGGHIDSIYRKCGMHVKDLDGTYHINLYPV